MTKQPTKTQRVPPKTVIPVKTANGLVQRLTLNQTHGVKRPPIPAHSQGIDGHDRRVFEVGCNLRLEQESSSDRKIVFQTAPYRLGKLPDLVARYKGKRAILFHHRAAFMWSAYLMGLDNLLMNLIADPELVRVTMDKVLACNMRIVQRAIRAGAEVAILGDDYAGNHGPMMSPALFRQFVLPPLAQMIAMIHD